VHPSDDVRAPHLLRTAVVLLAPFSLPVALWWSAALPAAPALGIALPLLVFALVESTLSGYDLRRSRCLGDALLRASRAALNPRSRHLEVGRVDLADQASRLTTPKRTAGPFRVSSGSSPRSSDDLQSPPPRLTPMELVESRTYVCGDAL
jgi:hypothetical protein